MVRAMIEDIVKSDLKTILHSKRANLYYLEKCRIMQKDGRIVYLTETKKENLFWNIPIANTTVILLGSGTSVTQAAMRLLSAAAPVYLLVSAVVGLHRYLPVRRWSG